MSQYTRWRRYEGSGRAALEALLRGRQHFRIPLRFRSCDSGFIFTIGLDVPPGVSKMITEKHPIPHRTLGVGDDFAKQSKRSVLVFQKSGNKVVFEFKANPREI